MGDDAVEGDPAADHVEAGRGIGDGPGRVGQRGASGGRVPGGGQRGPGSRQGRIWPAVKARSSSPTLVGHGEVASRGRRSEAAGRRPRPPRSRASSAGSAPTRCMPVSTFTWTSRTTPARAGGLGGGPTPAACRASGVSRRATTSAMASGGGSDRTSTGASMPASRSATPSSTRATANQVAPPSRAAAGHGHRAVAVGVGLDHGAEGGRSGRGRRSAALCRTAARSISAHRSGPQCRGDHVDLPRAGVGSPTADLRQPAGRGGRPGRRPPGPRGARGRRPARGRGRPGRPPREGRDRGPRRRRWHPRGRRRCRPWPAGATRPWRGGPSPPGSATTVVGPFSSTTRPAVARPGRPGRGDPVGARGRAGQAGELAVVGGEDDAGTPAGGRPRTARDVVPGRPGPPGRRRRPRRAPRPGPRGRGPRRRCPRGPTEAGTDHERLAALDHVQGAGAQPLGGSRCATASPAGSTAGSAPGTPSRTMPAPAR